VLRLSETSEPSGDAVVDTVHANLATTYDAVFDFFGRDSFDGAGATLIGSAHYHKNYCNAAWTGTQIYFGDGKGTTCKPLGNAVDVVGHEFGHAVVDHESNLEYAGQSGGMNEAFADLMGAFVRAWRDGSASSERVNPTNVWLLGDEIKTPFVRDMCDPYADGYSHDILTTTANREDPHYNSGIGNLAFCLLSNGGYHPREKTLINVPGLGFEKAVRILYKAQTDYLTSHSNYLGYRQAAEMAAADLYDASAVTAVGCAFAAVKVGTAPASCTGLTPPPDPSILWNGVKRTGLSGAAGSYSIWKILVPAGSGDLTLQLSEGAGNADLYVQASRVPTTTSYMCKSSNANSTETCKIIAPLPGTYYVMVRGASSFSGVNLLGYYMGETVPYLTSGIARPLLQHSTGSQTFYRIFVPEARPVTITISGGTGDADLYVNASDMELSKTKFDCRPYLASNNETCTVTRYLDGNINIMVRAYSAFSGVTLTASF
jgi:vibriolysin